MDIQYSYIGKVNYGNALRLMYEHIPKALSGSKAFWWGLEHDKVYTAGIASSDKDILDKSIKPTATKRGGGITLHNPGQLVFYSVFPLTLVEGGLQAYIRHLEAAVIQTLWDYNVLAFQFQPYSGVWTAQGKIGFIGLGVRNGVIYHGISINLINDLDDYKAIISCGLRLPITKLEAHTMIYGRNLQLNPDTILQEFSAKLQGHLRTRFVKLKGLQFRTYIKNILGHFYERSLSFRLGQLFFNERRFWEAHETWEVFWHECREGEFKQFLQGLIQLASALYKITTKFNLGGAYSLFTKALRKLQHNSYIEKYIKTLEDQMPLIEYIRYNLRSIETFAPIAPIKEQKTSRQADPTVKRKIYLPYTLAGKYEQEIFPVNTEFAK